MPPPDSEFFSVAYGQAIVSATVDVQSGASLDAPNGAVDVLANGTAVASMTADTPRNLGQNPPDPTRHRRGDRGHLRQGHGDGDAGGRGEHPRRHDRQLQLDRNRDLEGDRGIEQLQQRHGRAWR